MKTTCPISTINYNSPEYLARKLTALSEAGNFDFWTFVPHKPDVDEKKPHNHVYVRPAKQVDTSALTRAIGIEIFPDGTQGSNVKLWMKSKTFADWYLYGLHDPLYLASKGLKRNVSYTQDDFRASSKEDFLALVAEVNFRPPLSPEFLEFFAERGTPWAEIVHTARVNPSQYLGFKAMYNDVCAVVRGHFVTVDGQSIKVRGEVPDTSPEEVFTRVPDHLTPFGDESNTSQPAPSCGDDSEPAGV